MNKKNRCIDIKHARKRMFIPIHGAASWQNVGGVNFLVNSHFCGWESIITRLQELMIADMTDSENTELGDDAGDGDLFGGENTGEVSPEKP